MIGGGPLEESLKARATESRIPCRFTGFLPASEVRQWLNRAAVVAIPSVVASYGDSEGLPTIQLEAQAMGTPIVATRHSGIPEGVIHGVTANLVDERDTRALAMALRSFLGSRDMVRDSGEARRGGSSSPSASTCTTRSAGWKIFTSACALPGRRF